MFTDEFIKWFCLRNRIQVASPLDSRIDGIDVPCFINNQMIDLSL